MCPCNRVRACESTASLQADPPRTWLRSRGSSPSTCQSAPKFDGVKIARRMTVNVSKSGAAWRSRQAFEVPCTNWVTRCLRRDQPRLPRYQQQRGFRCGTPGQPAFRSMNSTPAVGPHGLNVQPPGLYARPVHRRVNPTAVSAMAGAPRDGCAAPTRPGRARLSKR
jgi:hypothetical protein